MGDISPADIWFDPRQILPAAKNALMYPITHPAQTAEFGLSVAPGSGEAMSAVDAWNASGRAGNALLSGDYGQAAGEYGNVLLGALGAIPGAGVIARGTKRGAAWMDRNLPAGVNRLLDAAMPSDPKSTVFSGAGPTKPEFILGADGQPLVVYHGVKNPDMRIEGNEVIFTPKFDRFDTTGKTEPGAWFSPDESVARKYGVPIPYHLKARNPLRNEDPLSARPEGNDAVYRMRGKGDDITKAWEIGVFDPSQIIPVKK